MDDLFFLLFWVSVVALFVGRKRPEWVRMESRKQAMWVFGAIAVVSLFLGSTFSDFEPSGSTDVVVNEAPRVEGAGAVAEASGTEEEGTPPEEVAGKVEDLGVPAVAAVPAEDGTPAPVDQNGELFDVVSIVDGDTIKVSIGGTVETLRLIGIDTPETKDPRKPVQCFGEEASRKATELLTGKRVRLEADATQGARDKYGRLLRYVWREDGLFFNEWMIRSGYAFEYTYNTPYQYQATFKEAQRYASGNNLGLWSPSTCDGDASAVAEVAPSPVVQTVAEMSSGGHTFYTSSYHTASFYYCDTDPGWEALSPKYLQSFPSESALLATYPSRTLHEACEG